MVHDSQLSAAAMNGLSADFVLRGGNVLPLDGSGRQYQAIAIRGDRILGVGAADEIDGKIGPHTRVIDLAGKTVIPGFNDAHAHMEREGLKRIRPSLAAARSIGDIVSIVGAVALDVPPGQWIVTMPVGEPPYYFGGPATLAEGRMPTRDELDRAAPQHPVCIPGHFGNWGEPPSYTALNSRALALNNITGKTRPRCSGVEIVKDAGGEPTGVIVEQNPRPTVEFDLLPAVPRFDFGERRRGALTSMRMYNAVGTTSVYEGHGSAPEIVSVYRSLWERNEMSVRVALVISPTWADVGEAAMMMRDCLSYARGQGIGDEWLRISGIHIAFGGDAQMAALARADLPNSGWSGFVEQANSRGDFREYCMLAAQHDLRLHTIIGDQLHELVPILAEVAERFPLAERRWVIEHVARARMEDLLALKQLGLIVTTIPVYFLWKGGHWYLNEPDGGDMVVPHQHLLDLEVPLAAATDNIPYDPLFTLWSMCTRHERRTGQVIGPAQRLSTEAALRLLTTAGSWLTFEETVKGPLLPNCYADLAVLSEDPLQVPAEQLKDITCKLTMVGGRIVHNNL
jgi:predicted amidohydrolase YtcJ